VLTETINRLNARNTILQSREELRNLTQRLHKIREEERMKISREIHDDLGQRLTAMKMDLSWINKHIPKNNQNLVQRLEAMISLTDSTLDITRKIALELRPAILDDLGLIPAIEWELQQFAKRTNCSYTVNLRKANVRMDRDRTIIIFRILQEALTNIIRHAHATHVDVRLTNDKNKAHLSVNDNGIGIDFTKLTDQDSLGIMSMRERAGAMGGTISIRNGKEGGTVVSLELPMH
jgi:signal transduction histidine kinase